MTKLNISLSVLSGKVPELFRYWKVNYHQFINNIEEPEIRIKCYETIYNEDKETLKEAGFSKKQIKSLFFVRELPPGFPRKDELWADIIRNYSNSRAVKKPRTIKNRLVLTNDNYLVFFINPQGIGKMTFKSLENFFRKKLIRKKARKQNNNEILEECREIFYWLTMTTDSFPEEKREFFKKYFQKQIGQDLLIEAYGDKE